MASEERLMATGGEGRPEGQVWAAENSGEVEQVSVSEQDKWGR